MSEVKRKRRQILRHCYESLKSATCSINEQQTSTTPEPEPVSLNQEDGISRISCPFEIDSDNSDVDCNSSNESSETSCNKGSSSCTSESDSDSNSDDIVADLRQFAFSTNQTLSAMNCLLEKLRKYHNQLPKDSRTLLKPKCVDVSYRDVKPGRYVHFGLFRGLQLFNEYITLSEVNVRLNIDGVHVFESSVAGFWPILGDIQELPNSVFIIGLYYGQQKPDSAADFLKEMLEEINEHPNDLSYKINLTMCCSDIPAKSFIKGTKGHSGYYSCERCVQKGVHLDNRVCFLETDAEPRSDRSFRLREQQEHHTGPSPFESIISIDMIQFFPIDYMHCICLGLIRRILEQLRHGRAPHRISHQNLREMNSHIRNIALDTPSDFARKPRSLQHLGRWKATELRLFGIYTGQFILKRFVRRDFWELFMSISVFCRIICHPTWCKTRANYCYDLAKMIIRNASILFGKSFVSLNVHYIIHLVEDCKRLGQVDRFSCFTFENFMRFLSRMVRSPNLPLQQVTKRIQERGQDLGHFSVESKESKVKDHNYCSFRNSLLKTKGSDRYVLTEENCIFKIWDIVTVEGVVVINGRTLQNASDAFSYPLPSNKVDIFRGCHFSAKLTSISLHDIKCKVFKLNDVFLPILHTYSSP